MQIFGKKDRFFTIFLLFFQKKSFFLRFSRCGCKKRAFVARLSRAAREFTRAILHHGILNQDFQDEKVSAASGWLDSEGAVSKHAYRHVYRN